MKNSQQRIAPVTGGVLTVDKPSGMTSHDVVNAVRRLYQTKKVGHTGTLDPMATGVLCVLVERAAKAAEYLVSDEKIYEATLRLGIKTTTDDTEGEITAKSDNIPSEDEVLSAVAEFVGKQKQIPPMYSALKKDGVKLIDLARRGIEVEREARDIEIFSVSAAKINETDYSLSVHCSKGTYIRTLCADIGEKLGCHGAMASLRRIKSGNFSIENAVTLEQLASATKEERVGLLLPCEALFEGCEAVKLNDFFARLAHSGNEIYQEKIHTDFELGKRIRLYDKDGFFALGEVMRYSDRTAIKPVKFFNI